MLGRLRLFLSAMRGRLPGAMALATNDDISISMSSRGYISVAIFIDDEKKRNAAYRALSAWYAGHYY